MLALLHYTLIGDFCLGYLTCLTADRCMPHCHDKENSEGCQESFLLFKTACRGP